MGKWGKYLKHYNPQWEKDKLFKCKKELDVDETLYRLDKFVYEFLIEWLQPDSENDVLNGKQEAYCEICQRHLRAHRNDLVLHKKTQIHKQRETSLNRKLQPSLQKFGCVNVSDVIKVTDLKGAMYIASYCSPRSVDHLGELLCILGKGRPLENIKIHRTKCSKLISVVIAPVFLTELVQDIGNSPYALIVDEATDVSVTKFMGICIHYFSMKRASYVTDLLGLVQLTDCTGSALANAAKNYLKVIRLPLQLHATDTDGASVMVGEHNSFYTHMKKDLIERMPTNLSAVEKLKFLSPHLVLGKVDRLLFQQLPVSSKDSIENQWLELGTTTILDIFPHAEYHSDIQNMDINHFWSCVLNFTNAIRQRPFKELAVFALKCLTMPVSNTVVERLFSVMSCMKDKRRNKLQIYMLGALLRIRIQMKVDNKCCKNFEPNKEMLSLFNFKMYKANVLIYLFENSLCVGYIEVGVFKV
ncbi:hypothetical protein TSAR_010454 [Trichomalopsis sarcophagae]|uniref:HAT C-terminal dimerisation domain-containing protein n=1 Tax=Trichomalopsis sarcophagae TaxID=543379 RepID=A0A232EIU6_9HYME|nr:hypothetical protein TSAR_010454 [Trichomalopsis sarcophagae]